MKIVVDENIPMANACFSALGEVVTLPGRHLKAEDIKDADALIVRSITQVDASLLQGTAVKFVGTATIGVDHIDQHYLQQQGIGFSSAPGCNAQSVVDYVMAALFELEHSRDFSVSGKSIGIIGLGNVGSRLKTVCEKLGLNVMCCDPPKHDSGEQGLVSLSAAWQADIVSLHVPLQQQGPYASYHLGNHERLNALRKNAVLINSSRGAVIDNHALSAVLNDRVDLSVVLDVWEGEPQINCELANQVDIATPHIAGYSHDGKVRGTWMIYKALCDFLGKECALTLEDLINPALSVVLDFELPKADDPDNIRAVINRVYNIRKDDVGLRSSLMLPSNQRGISFDALRKQYRVRREYNTVSIRHCDYLAERMGASAFNDLQSLGFQCH